MLRKDKFQLLKQRHQTWNAGRQYEDTESIPKPRTKTDSSPSLGSPQPRKIHQEQYQHQPISFSEVDVSIDNWMNTRSSGENVSYGIQGKQSSDVVSSIASEMTDLALCQDDDDPSQMMNKYKQQYDQYCRRCDLLQDEARGLEKERITVEQKLHETSEVLQKSQVDFKQYKILIESYQKKLIDLEKTIHESQESTEALTERLTEVKSQEQVILSTLSKLEKQKNNAKIIWTGIQSSLSSIESP